MIDYDSFSHCHLTDNFFRYFRGSKRVKFTTISRSLHNSYFIVYPAKMVDTTFEYRVHKQCVQKITTVQKSMYYPSYIIQRM